MQGFGDVAAADAVCVFQIRQRGWQRTFHCERLTEINNGIQLIVVICYCLASDEVASELGFHQPIGLVIAAYVSCKVSALQRTWIRTIGNFEHIFFRPLFFDYFGLQASVGYSCNLILGCG